MGHYKFSPKEEVAHIENLSQKMRVIEVKWKFGYVTTPNSRIQTGENGKPTFEKEKKRMIDGIECEWFFEGKLERKKFHSELLVPWPIAEKGKEAAEKFHEDMKFKSHAKSNT